MNGEKGQVLPLALLALAVGSLVIAPFLGHASSSLTSSRIYGQAIVEQYSCDAGVEHGIWHLQNGDLEVPEFTINDQTVNVTIDDLGGQVYKITSTATSDDGSSTTIEATVSADGGTCEWTDDGHIDEDTEGNVCVDGDIEVNNGVKVEGNVYATGKIKLKNSAEIDGDVYAGGDITLDNSAEITGDVSAGGKLKLKNSAEIDGSACAGGNITLYNSAEIFGSVYVTSDINEVKLKNNATIGSDVYIASDIKKIKLENSARIKGSIYITGNITDKLELGNSAYIEDDVYATGTINNIVREENIQGDVYENYTGEYPSPPECPEIFTGQGSIVILTWE